MSPGRQRGRLLALLRLIFPQVSSDYEDGLMFHVFGAEFCRAPCRGRGSPLVGRQGQRDDCIPGHPQHTRLLPIRYYWRNNPLDTELPDKQPPPLLMRPRAAPGWCRRQAGEGPCDPGKGFPVCFPALVGPGASGKWVPSTFCSGPSRVLIQVLRSLQGKVEASDTSLWCASALLQAHS